MNAETYIEHTHDLNVGFIRGRRHLAQRGKNWLNWYILYTCV